MKLNKNVFLIVLHQIPVLKTQLQQDVNLLHHLMTMMTQEIQTMTIQIPMTTMMAAEEMMEEIQEMVVMIAAARKEMVMTIVEEVMSAATVVVEEMQQNKPN